MDRVRKVEGRISVGLAPQPPMGELRYKINNLTPPSGAGGLFAMEFLSDLWNFVKERKKWWLMPMIVVLLLIGVLIVIGGGSAIAPFIYTLF